MFLYRAISITVLFFSLLHYSHAQRNHERQVVPAADTVTCDGDIGKSAFVPWALDLFNSVCGEEACQPQFIEAELATDCELSMPLDDGWIVRFNATDTNQKYPAWYVIEAVLRLILMRC